MTLLAEKSTQDHDSIHGGILGSAQPNGNFKNSPQKND